MNTYVNFRYLAYKHYFCIFAFWLWRLSLLCRRLDPVFVFSLWSLSLPHENDCARFLAWFARFSKDGTEFVPFWNIGGVKSWQLFIFSRQFPLMPRLCSFLKPLILSFILNFLAGSKICFSRSLLISILKLLFSSVSESIFPSHS